MKCKIFSGLAGLVLVFQAQGQTAFEYVNNVIVTTPPQVDALHFVNNHTFDFFFGLLGFPPYQTANTLTFTNRGLLQCDTGFRFDTFSTATGLRQPASHWVNHVTGTINAGVTTNLGLVLVSTVSKAQITADDIINRGVLNLAPDSVASFKGSRVDLAEGVVGIQSSLDGGAATVFDGYWGLRTVEQNPAASFGLFPNTPLHWVTNRYYQSLQTALSLPAATPYSLDVITGPSNRVVHAVFVQNLNPAFSNNVYITAPGGPVLVEWVWAQTNFLTDTVSTNRLVLQDNFGATTNFQLRRAGTAAPSTGAQPAFIPTNYAFFNGAFFNLGTPTPPGLPLRGFNNSNVTNEFTAYEAIFSASSAILGELAGQTFAHLPGRIEIEASSHLDLSLARLGTINLLSVKATNQYAGSAGARIAAPYADMDLRTTNVMTVTNLMLPFVPRLDGPVDLWSARWTNVDAFNFTNRYHVLFVNSLLTPGLTPLFTDLKLRSSNVVIHDVINVVSNFFTEAEHLTLATNAPGAHNPVGQLNLLNGQVLWPSVAPRLRSFTNEGVLQTFNAAFFRGERRPPYFGSSFNEPYDAFVNRGSITDQGTHIWARYFENSGFFLCGNGSFALEQNQTADLLGGAIVAGGDVTILGGSLTISNAGIVAGRALTLAATNLLTDVVLTNGNGWSVGDGFNLLVKPPVGDLLGTTVNSVPPTTIPVNAQIQHRWAGVDRDRSTAGFTNNAALGRLILDGGNGKRFRFSPVSGVNAIYVDYLELRNYTTNRSATGEFLGLIIDPNMKVYFAQAVMNGVSVAARLDQQNGGRLLWVSDYAGFYSGTNVVYPDGSTNFLNAALVQDQDLDSDCDGLANGSDQTPVFLVTTASLPAATNGAAYSTQLQSGGGVGTHTWSLAPASASLPDGLALSSSGVIAGAPTQAGTFNFTVRATQTSGCPLTADRGLSLTVHPASLVLSVAIVQHLPPGAQVTWNTKANAANYVYYRGSMLGGDWRLLTNFVSSVTGSVSVWDPVGTNQSRYYRVEVSSPTP